MSTEAHYKVYNGSAWVEYTFPPSSHTHSQYVTTSDSRLTDSRNAKDVYAWAKASTKPTYNGTEIAYDGTSTNYLARNQTVTTALTQLDTTLKSAADNISALQTALNSDDTTLDTLQEVVTYIKSNKSLIDSVTTNKQDKITSTNKLSYSLLSGTPTIPTNNNQLTNGAGYITGITKAMVTTALGYTPPTTDTNTWRGIQNNCTSDSTTDSLSAAQGKYLKGLIDGKQPAGSYANADHTHSARDIGVAYNYTLADVLNDLDDRLTVSNTNTTLAWGSTTTVATIGDQNINVKMPSMPSGGTSSVATTSANGLMSSTDKAKLNKLPAHILIGSTSTSMKLSVNGLSITFSSTKNSNSTAFTSSTPPNVIFTQHMLASQKLAGTTVANLTYTGFTFYSAQPSGASGSNTTLYYMAVRA